MDRFEKAVLGLSVPNRNVRDLQPFFAVASTEDSLSGLFGLVVQWAEQCPRPAKEVYTNPYSL